MVDPDSLFIEINGLDVHVKTAGRGAPVFVLLHGFGASLYSWQAVMAPFGQLGSVIAFDRPAFGLTGRPQRWEGQNPYGPEAQVDLLTGLLDHFAVEKAILVDPAVYHGGGAPGWMRPLLATPPARRLGPLLVRQIQKRGPQIMQQAWHDPGRIEPETLELYKKPLQVENWDKALWDFTLASRAPGLAEKLDRFTLPALVITGDDGRIYLCRPWWISSIISLDEAGLTPLPLRPGSPAPCSSDRSVY